jgi:hypothetical protein
MDLSTLPSWIPEWFAKLVKFAENQKWNYTDNFKRSYGEFHTYNRVGHVLKFSIVDHPNGQYITVLCDNTLFRCMENTYAMPSIGLSEEEFITRLTEFVT